VPGTAERDLASVELWQESLLRSQRRRVLAADARKDQARKKTASFAVSAAVAAAPMWPSVTATAADLSTEEASKLARDSKRTHAEKVLLRIGDESSAVAEVQRALGIADDGVFGPHTRAAVKDFQKRHDLLPTGNVDVKTWLKLFPTDMVVYAPPGSTSALGVNDTDHPEWAAVSTAPGAGTDRADAKAGHAAAAKAAKHGKGGPDAGRPSVHAASLGANGAPVAVGPNAGGGGGGVPAVLGSVVAPNGGGGGGWKPNFPPLSSFGSAKEMIAAMIRMANKIDSRHYAYRWGGGHNASFSGPYDCSGAVSAVLHAAGLLSRPMVSGEFMRWGAPGPGAVTIYANAGHVYMSILGRFFGTTRANPGGGAGWYMGGPRSGFAVVHVPFSKLHFKKNTKHKRKKQRRHRRKRSQRQSGPLNQAATTPPPPAETGGSAAPPPASSPPPSNTTTTVTTTSRSSPPPNYVQPAQPSPTAGQLTATPNPTPTTTAQPQVAPTAPAQTAPASPELTAPATGSEESTGSGTPNPTTTTPPSDGQGGESGSGTGTTPAPAPQVAEPTAPQQQEQGQSQQQPPPPPQSQGPVASAGEQVQHTGQQAANTPAATPPPKPPAAGGQSGQSSGAGGPN